MCNAEGEVLGQLNVEQAILFDQLPGTRMSDAATKAVERAKRRLRPTGRRCSNTRPPRKHSHDDVAYIAEVEDAEKRSCKGQWGSGRAQARHRGRREGAPETH